MIQSNINYKNYFLYDKQGRIIDKRQTRDDDESYRAYTYTYDSTGLMVMQIEYDYFDGKRDESRRYVYEYEKDTNGNLIKKNILFVQNPQEESNSKTDKEGNVKTTYYPSHTKNKSIMETIFYNAKGEMIKKIEYDRKDKPSFIRTYLYEYYN
jgi:hypothetical protein